jgi:hypothetical protein
MTDRTRLALKTLVGALALGVLGDLLLHTAPLGINLAIWMAALIAAAVVLAGGYRAGPPAPGPIGANGRRWVLLLALLFAAGFAWRDSPALNGLDILAILIALAMAGLATHAGSVRLASLTEYLLGLLLSATYVLIGSALLLLGDTRWKEVPRGGWTRPVAGVARGLVIAVPIVAIFGCLFMAADAVFQRMVTSLVSWDFEDLVAHLAVTAGVAWVTGGLLRQQLLSNDRSSIPAERPDCLGLGIVEIATILGAMNGLFLLFTVVQCRYLFGGSALVQVTTGLTYAEYARRGFLELVTAAGLVLPVLLVLDWLLRKEKRGHVALFRLLAGILVAMLFVVMASALQRMRLYQQAYGLTELRLYVTAFIGWLALVFVWFAWTVLRGRRDRFTFGAALAGFAAIGLLHAVNPDALIMRANAGRVDVRQRLDADYVTTLSADAVPGAIAALPKMSAAERRDVAAHLLERWSPPARPDWRAWNWSRARAWQAVQTNRRELENMAGP